MKKLFTNFAALFLILTVTFVFSPQAKAQTPTISSFSPASGAIGDTVTITGTGFDTSKTQNIVFFGATKAVVTSASATSLKVKVPLGATYQYISVTNLTVNLTAYSAKPFIVTLKGNIAFAGKQDFTTGTNPLSVSIGDIDGDGKPDLALANFNSNTLSVLRNASTSGTVSFAAKVDFATGSNPFSTSIGDIDGDGKPDLAVANGGSNTVSVFLNTSSAGSVSFATKADYATGSNPYSVSIGDIDGDGKPDLAVVNWGSYTVSILRNTSTSGSLSFAAKVDFPTMGYPRSVSIGDLDGDGKPDLAVTNTYSNTVSVLRNTSSSGSVSLATRVDFTTGTYPYSISIGDIDGDGKSDMALTNATNNTISVFRNTSTSGSLSFAAKADYTTGAYPYSVSIGDIDGDGKPDLAVANNGSNTISVFRSTSTSGSLSFAAKVDYATGSNPFSTSIGDLDGDGKPDLAVANQNSNTVSVIRQIIPPPVITSFSPASGAIGDTVTITGTGFDTSKTQNIVFFGATKALVISASATSLKVKVPLGATYQYISVTNLGVNLTGYSAKPFIVTLKGNIAFENKQDFTTGVATPTSVSIGDMDGDGKSDMVVDYGNLVSVFRNTSTSGTVSFDTNADFSLVSQSQSVCIGDIDGDGKPDMAVTNYNGHKVSVLRNTSTSGTVSFATQVDFYTGYNPMEVSIGDLDGDGKPELAVANHGAGISTVSVLRNTSTSGTVSFAAAVDFTTGYYPFSVSIGDIDGDGKSDLVVANSNVAYNTVSVLRNTSTIGNLSFATKVDLTSGIQPVSVRIGDIDGDGKPDLAVANFTSNTVSVFRNTSTSGNLNFATRVDFKTGSWPYSVSIGDIDGDGKPDLAVANDSITTVSVLRNTSTSGTVSFETKVDFTTGYGPRSVSIGDIDGDGKPDLAVANEGSKTVSVHRQIMPPVITSFSPESGAIGDTVTINGIRFNKTANQNIVFFGATQATVTAASDSSLKVIVPKGSTYQYFSVTNLNGNLTAYSAKPFIVTLAGNIAFGIKQDFSTGTGPYSVSIGDIDGDGKSDLAVANYLTNTVSILRNTSSSGTVSFATKVDLTTGATGAFPSSVSIGDIDGDGKPDIVVTNYNNSATVSIFRNTSTSGTISFATKTDLTIPPKPSSVSIGDIDGDGKPDLVVTNDISNTVSVLRNTSTSGSVSFSSKVDFNTGISPLSVSIGDIDGDGKPDLAVANAGGNTVSVFRNTSTPSNLSFASKVDFPTGTGPYSVSIGDIDGDGKPDLATANYSSSTLSVLRNTSTSGSLSFATKIDFTTGIYTYSLSLGDLNGDGKPDLAVIDGGSKTVSVFRNSSTFGTVSFATKVDYTTGSSPVKVSIGDLDGDGKPDLVVANMGSNTVSVIRQIVPVTIASFSPESGAIGDSVIIKGTGFNKTANQNIVFFGATQATVTNANDSSLTVVIPVGATFQYITVTNLAVNLTAYSAKPFIVTLAGNIVFANKKDFTTGTGPYSVSIGDIDGDGKTDLAVANISSATISLFRNISTYGKVNFANKVDYSTGTQPISVSIGDIDGDGKHDLAIANYMSNTISVFRNTSTSGSLSFATKVDYAIGYGPSSVSIGDIDGDGKPDLAVAGGSNTISVFRNISTPGSLSFATSVNFTTGTNPKSISIGDFDGDGKPDLAVANVGSATISVFRNTSTSGSVSFAAKVDFATGLTNYTVSIGDLDGDGKPDLAVANYGSNTVSVIRNISTSGTVNFATKVDFTTGSNPYSVNMGDLDGDGKPDLAVTNASSATVSVFRNTSTSGSMSFASKVDFATGSNPFSVSIGDIDGDGGPDLAVVNQTSNTVSVIRQIMAPAITSFTPTSSCTVKTIVTITGNDFTGATAVTFGGTNAVSFTVDSATQITATVGSGSTGKIGVTSSLGTGYSADSFIVNSNTGTDVKTACNSYKWIDGKTYTSSNSTATDTLTNIFGCDSIVTLNLTINYPNTGTDVQASCNSYTWIDGKTYTSSNNTATDTLTNMYGCDSIVTLNLTIYPSPVTTFQITSQSDQCLNGNLFSFNNTTTISSGTFSSLWKFADGNTSTQNNPTHSYINVGTYPVRLVTTSNNGCKDSVVHNAIVYAPQTPVISIAGKTLVSSNPYGNKWSNGDTGKIITPIATGTYYVTTVMNGCRSDTSNKVVINNLNIFPPDICLVTVDSASGKNLVVWERYKGQGIASYNVYKESNSAGVYNKIGNVPFSQLSVFMDINSNPRKKADRYYITSIDSATGAESARSNIHQTLHLAANKGTSGEINLIWSHYEGFAFGSYIIYRGKTPSKLTRLDSIQSTMNFYTDPAPPKGNVYYLVVALKPDICYPGVFRAQTNSGPYSQSISNLKDYSTVTDFYLTVSPQQATVGADSGSNTYINVYTNLPDWNATVNQTWASIAIDTSTNILTLTVQKNPTAAIRMATVTITGGTLTPQTVLVLQDGTTTGIKYNNVQQGLRIYPNPSTGKATIEYDLISQDDVQIVIFDMMGKQVRELRYQNQSAGKYNSEINLSDSPKGIYFINMFIGLKTYTGKLVVE